MNRRILALILVVVGVIIYFYPQFQQFTIESGKVVGAIFAVGGVVLCFLPEKAKKK